MYIYQMTIISFFFLVKTSLEGEWMSGTLYSLGYYKNELNKRQKVTLTDNCPYSV